MVITSACDAFYGSVDGAGRVLKWIEVEICEGNVASFKAMEGDGFFETGGLGGLRFIRRTVDHDWTTCTILIFWSQF